MGSTTPKYALPYPVGTDRVMDGDDAIKALAERVEVVMSTGKAWHTTYPTTNPITANGVWTDLYSVTLTGCPVGAIVLAMWSATMQTPPVIGGFIQTQIVSTGVAWINAGSGVVVKYNSPSATQTWAGLSGMMIGTTTVADAVIRVQGFATGGGTASIGGQSGVTAVRVA